MDYDLSQKQEMLKEEAHRFFLKECDSPFVRKMLKDDRGYTKEMWYKMAELGWTGLLIPKHYGGSFESFIDMMVILYEMGYVCFPGPFFSTAVVGAITLLEAGNEDQKKTILPEVAKGNLLLTLALTEPNSTFSPEGVSLRADRQDDDYMLDGTKLFVPDAHVADIIFCVGRTEESRRKKRSGLSFFMVDRKAPGISICPLETFTGEKLCEVDFDHVRIRKENLLGKLNQGWPILKRVLQKTSVAKCAEMSGGGQKVLEMVVAHAKERKQFGHPIGSFQAIQQHCADILTFVDTCRLMTYEAGWRISEGLPFEKDASMCKAWVSDSYRRLVALGHQVMGGKGFLEDHDIHLYFYRAKAGEQAFGDAEFHREMVVQAMGL